MNNVFLFMYFIQSLLIVSWVMFSIIISVINSGECLEFSYWLDIHPILYIIYLVAFLFLRYKNKVFNCIYIISYIVIGGGSLVWGSTYINKSPQCPKLIELTGFNYMIYFFFPLYQILNYII